MKTTFFIIKIILKLLLFIPLIIIFVLIWFLIKYLRFRTVFVHNLIESGIPKKYAKSIAKEYKPNFFAIIKDNPDNRMRFQHKRR